MSYLSCHGRRRVFKSGDYDCAVCSGASTSPKSGEDSQDPEVIPIQYRGQEKRETQDNEIFQRERQKFSDRATYYVSNVKIKTNAFEPSKNLHVVLNAFPKLKNFG